MTPGALTPARASRGVEAVSLLMLAARLPQIAKNAAAKSTGQLSLATYGANLAGATARVFTSLTEGGGAALVRSYALSALLNGTLVAQIMTYGRGGGKKKRGGASRRRRSAAKATQTRRAAGRLKAA
jgi:mannose-P-dolichol utilization defect protein 1